MQAKLKEKPQTIHCLFVHLLYHYLSWKNSIKVSSGLETASIALAVSTALQLVVTLASYVTKSSLKESLDPWGPTSIVVEQRPPSLLVATSRKFMQLRENKLVPNSSASLESLDSITLIPVSLSCS